MGEVELLVKLRDAHRMAADALEERLEELAPKCVTDALPDLEGVIWSAAIGQRGKYEKTTEDASNPKYKMLLKAVKEHQGKVTVDSYFVWLFDDGKTIGRKPK